MQKFLKWVIYLGLLAVVFTPFMMSSSFFFPFIFTKVLIFRVAVEIMVLAYLLLATLNKNYHPKINILTVSFLAYIVIIFISSLINNNFYLSFWGDVERSEGILLLLHLFALFIIISGILKKKSSWLLLFDGSILGSIFVGFIALGQKLNWNFVINSGESRISATIGNPAFLASYLIFTSGFALYLFFERKNKIFKIYYPLVFFLEIYLIFQTATRGAIVGLLVTLFLAVILIVFFSKTKKKLKQSFSIFLLLVVIFSGIAFQNKDAQWVQNSNFLKRMVSISFNDRTTDTRLMTWQSAWQGVKEKPILGWGYENFYVVFNKYFNPRIYEDAGSRIWFDRAHNIIFDRLVTGGFLGLLAYLFLIFYPIYFLLQDLIAKRDNLFKRLFKKLFQKEDSFDDYFSIIFISLLVAYFIQDIFVFDILVSYLPLIILLGFLGFYLPEIKIKILEKKYFYKFSFVVFLLLFIPIIYVVNIKPAKANIKTVDGMRYDANGDFVGAYNSFQEALSYNTYGNQEFRVRFAEFVDNIIHKRKAKEEFRRKAALKVSEELKKQISERPDDVSNYILLMRHYNKVYIYDIEFLNDVRKIFDQAIVLSPTRPHLYYERGYANIYLGNYYQQNGDFKKAKKFHQEGILDFEKAIEFNDKVVDSYINAVLMSFISGQPKNVQKYIAEMKAKNLFYKRPEFLKRIAAASYNTKNYDWTVKFYEDLIKIDQNNPQNFINLSLAYLYIGEKEKAIETARMIDKFGENYKKKSDDFIKQIKDPNFDLKKIK